jgi:hypothetical protein
MVHHYARIVKDAKSFRDGGKEVIGFLPGAPRRASAKAQGLVEKANLTRNTAAEENREGNPSSPNVFAR